MTSPHDPLISNRWRSPQTNFNTDCDGTAGPNVELDLRTLYLKDLRLIGCTILEPGVFAHLVGYIERAEIRPLVARVYPLSEIVAAQEEFLRKRHIGKIVLTPPAQEPLG